MAKPTIQLFLSSYMGKTGYKHEENAGVTKFYNKDFDVIMYKNKKQDQALVIDKRNNVVYNNLDIAIDNLDAS